MIDFYHNINMYRCMAYCEDFTVFRLLPYLNQTLSVISIKLDLFMAFMAM